jgi:hypothetical protein
VRVTTTGHVFIGLRITGIGEVVDVEESLGESLIAQGLGVAELVNDEEPAAEEAVEEVPAVDVEESLGESVEESQPAPVVTPAVAALVAVTGRLYETHKRRKGKR